MGADPGHMDAKLKDLLDHQIEELEAQIEQVISTHENLATTAGIRRSVPGIGPVASELPHADRQNARTRPDQRRASCRAHRPAITIQSSKHSPIGFALQENHTRSSSLPLQERLSQSQTHSVERARNGRIALPEKYNYQVSGSNPKLHAGRITKAGKTMRIIRSGRPNSVCAVHGPLPEVCTAVSRLHVDVGFEQC